MNLKKAKLIRALVTELVKKEVLKEPWTRYGAVNHRKFIDSEKPGEDGKIKKIETNRQTQVLDPMCPRGVYHRMKANTMAAVLAGQA